MIAGSHAQTDGIRMKVLDPVDMFDVVIIGAGFAGAIVAHRLTDAGFRVLVLEAGLALLEEDDDRLSLRRKYAASSNKQHVSPFAEFVATQPYASDSTGMPWGSDYFVQDVGGEHDPFQGYYMRMVGGTGMVWQGVALRMAPSDLKMSSTFGVGRDWPIAYADLEPWYGEAEREIGVAGDPEADTLLRIARSTSFPMPPIPPSYLDQQIAAAVDGTEFEGVRLKVSPTPQARNSIDGYDGRPLCEGHASCVPLCPTRAKYEPLVHIRRALLMGAELRTGAVASHLDLDDSGHVTTVCYRHWDGSEAHAGGRLFVIAANAVETPKLLLQSSHQRAAGLANASGLVGLNLMDHPLKLSYALLPQPVYPFRGPQATSSIEVVRDGPFRTRRAAFRTTLRNDGWRMVTGAPQGRGVDSPIDYQGTLLDFVGKRGLFGSALRRSFADHAARQVVLQSTVEMLPDPANRVTLSPVRDRFGLPRPALQFRLGAYARAGITAAARLHDLVFRTMGAPQSDVILHLQEDESAADLGGSHLMGTTVMGTEANCSVVDPDCRTHDHSNLFILGSSVFPTGSTVNPTLTIVALALRAADTICKSFAKLR